MTEQKLRIRESAEYIKEKSPFKKSPSAALISYCSPLLAKNFKIIKKLKCSDIPPEFDKNLPNDSEFLFAEHESSGKEFYVLNGRFNYYQGYKMRDVTHPVYTLNELGVKTLIMIDEVGFLNPRFTVGGTAFIYDHINLMGDNPLIGENDYTIGPRFPDMSNPYNESLYKNVENLFIENKFRYYPSVYLGITGPETETEAECRFYREAGADVLGYSLVPENLAAIHAGMKVIAFGMISRELVADRLKEISEEEQSANRIKAEKNFNSIFPQILKLVK
jgi:purine-nucleoside phosphorylase